MFLNCHTYFSFTYATLSVEQLVQQASQLGVSQLTLTDIHHTSAALDFIHHCQAAGIQWALGVEFRSQHRLQYLGLARSHRGFQALNEALTMASEREFDWPDTLCLPEVVIIYPWGSRPPEQLGDHEYLGLRATQCQQVRKVPHKLRQKLVAWHPVTLRHPQDLTIHRVLRSIDQNILLTQLDDRGGARAEDCLITPQQLRQQFASFPFLLQQAEQLHRACQWKMDVQAPKNKRFFTRSRADDYALLQKLAWTGFAYRYPEPPRESLGESLGESSNAYREWEVVRQRLTRELEVIDTMGFTANYLIVWDVIGYAEKQGYFWIGRGSAANSMVAYCLKITDVDPIALELTFERFINPHRAVPPDFDMDFSWTDRDDVLDYIFRRYGKGHVTFLSTYNRFKRDSALREVAKIYGLPKAEIDRLVKEPVLTPLHHPLSEEITALARQLIGLPSHLSMHAGGILITEEPLSRYTALKMMPKGFPVSHFDMHTAEDYQFFKFDILSQRGLGHIKTAVGLVRKNRQEIIDIHRVQDFFQDEQLLKQLATGNTMGCFYIESPAMRQLLLKLRCRDYPSLVAASSVIRPGVAQSGMMREFIQRHLAPAQVKYLHPIFKEQLGETHGVMVYQEDVMKIAHAFGGISLDDTDVLRRAMSGKYRGRSHFEVIKGQYFENCYQRGYSDELAQTVWQQMESFAGYSFCKAHSASYAVESFQSLFLKTYYPLEFFTAVVNNFGGFYRTEIYLHAARLAGATVHAPDINRSDMLTTIYGSDIYVGFQHIKQLESRVGEALVFERQCRGEYRSLEDFIRRLPVSRSQLDLLIRIGAFRCTGKSKQVLLWEKNCYLTDRPTQPHTWTLFDAPTPDYPMPALEYDPLEEAFEHMELLGFPLVSPFQLLAEPVSGLPAASLKQQAGKTVSLVGYYVTRKPVYTKHKKRMAFGTWIDPAGDFFDTVHFPDSLRKFPLQGIGCYDIRGKVTLDFGVPTVQVSGMEKLPMVPDPRYADAKKPFRFIS